jgi:hypothetical protein
MAKLMVSRGGATLGSWFIEDKRVTIGRADGVDVRLDSQAVSKQHAAIEVMGADHILVDLDSSNGTFVNGSRVSRHLLRHGDTIEVLDFQMRYIDHRSIVAGEGDRTMIFRAADAEVSPAALANAPALDARPVELLLPAGVLKCISGKRSGQQIELDRALTPLGERGKDYAAIFRRPGGFAIARVRGRPPRLDGKYIGDGWQALREGATVELSGEKYKLQTV